MRRLPKFEDKIVRADANYFLGLGFITQKQYDDVMAWLDGADNKTAQSMIISWLKRDANYGDMVRTVGAKTLWYIAPFVRLGLRIISWKLRRMATKLERELSKQ